MKVTPKLKRKSVVLTYKLNNVLYEVYTGISIEPDKWSSKKIIKGEGRLVSEQNAKIKKLQSTIELYIFELKRDGKEYFHQELKNYLKSLEASNNSTEGSSTDFVSFFEKFIKEGEHKYANQTLKAYKTTKRHITDFIRTKGKKSIAFDSFTLAFFREFNTYLKTVVKLSPPSRGKQIKNIKAVLNEALRSGLHSNRDFQDVKKDHEHSVNVYLNIAEINKLNEFNGYSETERKLMDAFIFICLTGLRYTDYNQLQKQNFSREKLEKREVFYIKFVQEKTREEVKVPLMYREAITILEKYNWELPKFANAHMNREIKEILVRYNLIDDEIQVRKEKMNGSYVKRDLVTVHTGRRSFCTNQYLNGTPSQFIMAASGHKTESAFRLYIKADQLDKAKGLVNYLNY